MTPTDPNALTSAPPSASGPLQTPSVPPARCGRFQKGVSGNPGGRRKGSKNEKTLVLDALRKSFKGVGGARFLANLATTQPKAYAALLSRDIVERVESEHTIAGDVQLRYQGLTDQELAVLAHAVDAEVVNVSPSPAAVEAPKVLE